MLDQLIRQEALDAYTERWLGEISASRGIPPISLALTGCISLAGLLAILFLGVYTRETTLEGITNGPQTGIVLKDTQAHLLKPGESVPFQVQGSDRARGRFTAEIASIVPVPESGNSLYRVRLRLPSSLSTAQGKAFLVRIPLERRHIYEWMVSCSPN